MGHRATAQQLSMENWQFLERMKLHKVHLDDGDQVYLSKAWEPIKFLISQVEGGQMKIDLEDDHYEVISPESTRFLNRRMENETGFSLINRIKENCPSALETVGVTEPAEIHEIFGEAIEGFLKLLRAAAASGNGLIITIT
jgi:hypothetical protein